MLIDSHCHLDYDGLRDDLDAVIARAEAANVKGMMAIFCKGIEDSLASLKSTIDGRKNIWASLGVHPHEAKDHVRLTTDELIAALKNHPQIVSVGEAGLDYHYDYSPRDQQKKVFLTHIHAAQETGLPLVVHTREAEIDTFDILQAEVKNKPFKAIMHCFTGTKPFAHKCLDLDFHLSFSGVVTFPKAEELREVAKSAPLNRILVETDSPYLAPAPHRGKPNEPAYVTLVAQKVAEVRSENFEKFSIVTTENFLTLINRKLA